MRRTLLMFAALIFTTGFIAALPSGSAAYEYGDMKLDGIISYDGRIGEYNKTVRDPLTLSLYKAIFTNDDQFFDADIRFEHLHDMSSRQIFDFKNHFRGVSRTPQDLDFKSVSNMYNYTSMQYAISHNNQSISSVYFDAALNRFSHSALKELSRDVFTFGYALDHMTSENTYYTFKTEGSANKYSAHDQDDYAYSASSFKILHKMPKISRTPSYFSAYIFDKRPISDDPDYVHFTDLTYELKAEYASNKMAYNNAGNFKNLKLDYSLHLDFSKISKVNINGYIDRRSYDPEAVTGLFLNCDKSYLNLLYSHDIAKNCTFTPYIDFVKYNYLNLSGLNMTQIGFGNYLSLKYSESTYWNFDLKRTAYMPFESRFSYPQQAKINFVSNFIKYLSVKRRLVLDNDFELMKIGANESIYLARYSQFSSELRLEYKLMPDFYTRFGFGGAVKKYPAYAENDIYDIYGLIGMTAYF